MTDFDPIFRVVIPPNAPADWESWVDETDERDCEWTPFDSEVPWDGRTLGATVDFPAAQFLDELRRQIRSFKQKGSAFHHEGLNLPNKLKLALWLDEQVHTDQEFFELPTSLDFDRYSAYYLEDVICTELLNSSLRGYASVTCLTCQRRCCSDSLSQVEYLDSLGPFCYVLLCPASHHLFVTYRGLDTNWRLACAGGKNDLC